MKIQDASVGARVFLAVKDADGKNPVDKPCIIERVRPRSVVLSEIETKEEHEITAAQYDVLPGIVTDRRIKHEKGERGYMDARKKMRARHIQKPLNPFA